jgi:hypothetical protein
MGEHFPECQLDRPFAIDVASNGRLLLIDHEGMRLCTGSLGEPPSCGTLHVKAKSAALLESHIILLEVGAKLHTLQPSGAPIGSVSVRKRASCLAVAPSGSVLVGYGPEGYAEHGVLVERLGSSPLTWSDSELGGVTALAADSGGVWVVHGTWAQRLRPVPGSFETAQTVTLPADARAATIGPDGALFVLLEPGDRMVRAFGDEPDPPVDLPAVLLDIAGGGGHLWGCGEPGLVELTDLVPPP